jgi:hypothetical protein
MSIESICYRPYRLGTLWQYSFCRSGLEFWCPAIDFTRRNQGIEVSFDRPCRWDLSDCTRSRWHDRSQEWKEESKWAYIQS